MPIWLSIALIVLFATVIMRIAGFGGALISMPLFTPLLGVATAVPLMNLIGITSLGILLIQFRREINFRDISLLTISMLLCIPVGVLAINYVPGRYINILVGITCISYALYRVAQLPLPKMNSRYWAVPFGAASGILSGATNIPGPPVIIYTATLDWNPQRYRLNMFAFFFVSSLMSLIVRLFVGQFSAEIGGYYLYALPALLCGIVLGDRLSSFIPRDIFGKLVVLLIFLLGVRVLWSAF